MPHRRAFLVCLGLCALLPWLNTLPPLVDLPQHAAQVASMADLLRGISGWTDLVRLNFMTPYLIGYLGALALHQVMPIETAFKILLSLAYLGTVGMLVLLRRRLGGDARLDWLFLLSYFGFAYQWGFLPFLVGAPFCLAVALAGHCHAEAATTPRALALFGLGLLAFFSHGLMFLLGCGLAGLFLLPRLWRRQAGLVVLWPFVGLGLLAVAYFLSAPMPVTYAEDGTPNVAYAAHLSTNFGSTWQRAPEFLVYPLGTIEGLDFAPLTVALLALPWVLGAGIDWHRLDRLVPFGTMLAIWCLMPNTAMQTGFLYERFALFLLPFYALMFGPGATSPRRARATALLGCAVCLIFLGITATRLLRQEAEAFGFRQILAQAAPRGLALSLIFDRSSPALRSRDLYMHYPAWYQARSGGFVEFSFAFFLPGIVRYRPGMEPNLPDSVELHPERFRFSRHGGRRYRYIFTRGATPALISAMADDGCRPHRIAQAGPWSLYGGCEAAAARVASLGPAGMPTAERAAASATDAPLPGLPTPSHQVGLPSTGPAGGLPGPSAQRR